MRVTTHGSPVIKMADLAKIVSDMIESGILSEEDQHQILKFTYHLKPYNKDNDQDGYIHAYNRLNEYIGKVYRIVGDHIRPLTKEESDSRFDHSSPTIFVNEFVYLVDGENGEQYFIQLHLKRELFDTHKFKITY